ncbi:hypothetical protein ACFL28_01825 [Candidatus Omnitrophota bacterium]
MKFFRPILIIVILTCFCLSLTQYLGAKEASSMKLTLLFDEDKLEYKLKDPIYISFRLKNIASKPIYINKRFFVNSEDSQPGYRELFLEVTGPSGEKLPGREPRDTGFPRTGDFVLLEPDEEITSERKKSLRAYFDLEETGKYKIVAIYHNVYGEEIGVDTFRDKVTSKPVTIKIEKE